jgi:hypothetical protein
MSFARLKAIWSKIHLTNGGGGGRASATIAAVEPLEERVQCAADAAAVAGNAKLPDLMPWASKTRDYVYGWHLDRSEKPGRTLLRLTTAMANVGKGPMELRGGTVTAGGQNVNQRIYNADGTHNDVLAGVFTYHSEHDHVHFDDFASYRLRAVTATGGVGAIIRTGTKVSFCLTDSDEYDVTLPGSPNNGSYFSCSGTKQGISVGWADVYSDSLADQWIDVTRVKSGKYFLEVAVDPHNRIVEENETNNVVRIPIVLKQPVKPRNDDFGKATPLEGDKPVVTGSNSGASRQPGEPTIAGITGGSSIWYKWVAPRTMRVGVTTFGSDFDTLLGVYRGPGIGSLQKVADDDDESGRRTSRVNFAATKGTTYYIAVDGYRGATGKIKLSIVSP